MNFTSNKKRRLSYQKKAVESKKKRKTSPSNSLLQKNSERFNYFIDILNTNKKDNLKKKSSIRENKENNPDNVNDLSDKLKAFNSNNHIKDLITVDNINNSILEEIEKNVPEDNKVDIVNDKGKNIANIDVSNNEVSESISAEKVPNDLELKKYFKKSKLLHIKENKIIQRNINLILNKEKKSNKSFKINKKEIDIVNQFQLNALGYINFYTKRRRELLNSQKANTKQNNIFKLNEEELERLIDQEWIILDKITKNEYIEAIVKKQTRLAKKKIKNKKTNVDIDNPINNNTQEINLDNENLGANERDSNSSIQQQSINIPNIPGSEVIENELKEYTEINLLIEMYNHAKQVPIPHFSVIKHPPNPFTIYTKDNINTIIKKNPTMNRTEALKIVAKNWKKASINERKKYIEKSKEYKDDYEDLIKYAYLQRALIQDPSLAKRCLEYQLKKQGIYFQ